MYIHSQAAREMQGLPQASLPNVGADTSVNTSQLMIRSQSCAPGLLRLQLPMFVIHNFSRAVAAAASDLLDPLLLDPQHSPAATSVRQPFTHFPSPSHDNTIPLLFQMHPRSPLAHLLATQTAGSGKSPTPSPKAFQFIEGKVSDSHAACEQRRQSTAPTSPAIMRMSGLVRCKIRVNATNFSPPGIFCTILYVPYLHNTEDSMSSLLFYHTSNLPYLHSASSQRSALGFHSHAGPASPALCAGDTAVQERTTRPKIVVLNVYSHPVMCEPNSVINITHYWSANAGGWRIVSLALWLQHILLYGRCMFGVVWHVNFRKLCSSNKCPSLYRG